MAADHQRLGLRIDEETNSHGGGEPMNLAYVVDIIANIITGPPRLDRPTLGHPTHRRSRRALRRDDA